jgi:hypothetical protein
LRIAAIVGQRLRGLDRLLRLDRESVWLQSLGFLCSKISV